MRFLIPWRGGDEARERLRVWTSGWWQGGCPDIPQVLGASPSGPFNRSAAINDAAHGDWDFAVVLDADVVALPEQVYAALAKARATGRVTLAFDMFLGLTPHATETALSGGPLPVKVHGKYPGTRYTSDVHESSCVIIPRPVWDLVGGFDERFIGWGQEDVAFVQAARVLAGGVDRVAGSVWHLWHANSPERDRSRPQWQMNQALGNRYRATVTPDDMRALLREKADARASV